MSVLPSASSAQRVTPLGGSADPDRRGPLRRRRAAARHAPRRVRPQPDRPRHASRASTSAPPRGCPASSPSTPATTSRRCSARDVGTAGDVPGHAGAGVHDPGDRPRCGSSATRSRWSWPRAATSPRTPSSSIEVDYDELPPIAIVGRRARPEQAARSSRTIDATCCSAADGLHVTATSTARSPTADRRGARARCTSTATRTCRWSAAGIVADYDPGDRSAHRCTASTRACTSAKMILVGQLGHDPDKLRVLVRRHRRLVRPEDRRGREDIAVAAASHAARAAGEVDRGPQRAPDGVGPRPRGDASTSRLAVTDDGDLLGLKVDMIVDTGAYPGMGGDDPRHSSSRCSRARTRSARSRSDSTATVTNKATYVAYRGPWAAEAFMRERMIDIVAKRARASSRSTSGCRNVVTRDEEPTRMVTGPQPRRRHDAGVARAHGRDRRPPGVPAAPGGGARRGPLPRHRHRRPTSRRRPGPNEGGGGGLMGDENMRMRLDADGTVLVYTGQMPHGQSHETTFAQIAADEIGVPFEQVRVVVGDSDTVAVRLHRRQPGGDDGRRRGAAHGPRAEGEDPRRASPTCSRRRRRPRDHRRQGRGAGRPGVSAIALAERRRPARLPDDADDDLEVDRPATTAARAAGPAAPTAPSSRSTSRPVRCDDRALRRRRGLREAHQPGDRRGPGARRRRPGHRRGAARARPPTTTTAQFLAGTFMDYLLPTTTEIPRIEIDHLETVPLDPDVNFRGVGEGGMIVAPADARATPSRTRSRRSASRSPSSTCRRSASSSSIGAV